MATSLAATMLQTTSELCCPMMLSGAPTKTASSSSEAEHVRSERQSRSRRLYVSSKAGSFKDVVKGYERPLRSLNCPAAGMTSLRHNDANLTDALYTYTVDDKGVYTLTYAGIDVLCGLPGMAGAVWMLLARARSSLTRRRLLISLATNIVASAESLTSPNPRSSSARALTALGSPSLATPQLPALICCSIVDYTLRSWQHQLRSCCLPRRRFLRWRLPSLVIVTNWKPFNWANGYDLITVYVDGEPVVVNVEGTLRMALQLNGNWHVEHLSRPRLTTERRYLLLTVYALRDGEVLAHQCYRPVDGSAMTCTAVHRWKRSEGAVGLTNPAICRVLKNGTLVKADGTIEAADILDRLATISSSTRLPAGQPYYRRCTSSIPSLRSCNPQ